MRRTRTCGFWEAQPEVRARTIDLDGIEAKLILNVKFFIGGYMVQELPQNIEPFAEDNQPTSQSYRLVGAQVGLLKQLAYAIAVDLRQRDAARPGKQVAGSSHEAG